MIDRWKIFISDSELIELKSSDLIWDARGCLSFPLFEL